jgi:hypothetical protein
MDISLGEEIGHGAYGHVHVDRSGPSLCIKMSNKCRCTGNFTVERIGKIRNDRMKKFYI